MIGHLICPSGESQNAAPESLQGELNEVWRKLNKNAPENLHWALFDTVR